MAGDNALALKATVETAGQMGGWWQDVPLPLFSGKTAGLTLTAGTNPIVATNTSRDIIRWAATDVADLTYNWVVPGNYDQDADALKLLLTMVKSTAGDAGTATINATALLSRAGTAFAAAVVSVGAQTISDATTPSVVTIDFDRKNYTTAKTTLFQPGDVIQFDITPGAHATAVLDLIGVRVAYKGSAALWDPTRRYA